MWNFLAGIILSINPDSTLQLTIETRKSIQRINKEMYGIIQMQREEFIEDSILKSIPSEMLLIQRKYITEDGIIIKNEYIHRDSLKFKK